MNYENLKTDYSAVGDGTTDDTQALLDAMLAPDPLFIPAGNYKITDDVACALAGKQVVAAPGATLEFAATKGLQVQASGFALDGLSFKGALDDQWQILLSIMGADVEDPICGFRLTNLNFDTVYGQAILPRYAHHGFIQNVHAKNVGYAALAFETCFDWDVRSFNACDINIHDFWGSHQGNSYGIYSSNQVGDPVSRRINVDGFRIFNNPVWNGVDTHGGEDITYRNGFIKDCMFAASFGVGDSGQTVRPIRPRLLDTTIVYSQNLNNDSIIFVGTDQGECRGVTVHGGGKNHANYGVLKYYDNNNLLLDNIRFVNPALNGLSDYNGGNVGTTVGRILTQTSARQEAAEDCSCGGSQQEEPDPEVYQIPIAVFDGTNDYLLRSSDFTGNADSKKFLASGWFKTTATGQRLMYCSFSGNFFIGLHTDGRLRVDALTSGGVAAVRAFSAAALNDGNRHHFAIAADALTSALHLYVDDADALAASPTQSNNTIDFTTSSHAIGASTGGVSKWNGELGQLWIGPGQYLDLSNPTNRLKFYDNGPVDLGAAGATPTGVAPLVFLNNAFGSFHTNLGTGGAFTLNGALADGGLEPV